MFYKNDVFAILSKLKKENLNQILSLLLTTNLNYKIIFLFFDFYYQFFIVFVLQSLLPLTNTIGR